jgi:hypothetical protein
MIEASAPIEATTISLKRDSSTQPSRMKPASASPANAARACFSRR